MMASEAGKPQGRLLLVGKWLWLLACAVVVIELARRYWPKVATQAGELAWWQLAISAMALVAGKLLLAVSARHAVQSQGWRPQYMPLLAMVSLSQMGKYLPGGIWHFVGRAAMYSAHGLRPAAIAKGMMLENGWQWGAALLVGAVFMLYSSYEYLHVSATRSVAVLVCGAASALLWWIAFRWTWRRFAAVAGTDPLRNPWRVLLLQGAAWACLGISFGVLFPMPSTFDDFMLAIGAFALAAVAGFLVPIAPAGLGVREVVLVALLARVLTAEQAAICAAVSRFIWLVVEAALVLLLHGRSSASGTTETAGTHA